MAGIIESSPAQRVIAAKGSKRVHLVAPKHGENVTVVASVFRVNKNKKQNGFTFADR